MSDREKRDLVLTPEQYAFMQEVTNGLIKTHVGPTVINQTAQDQPVRFDPEDGSFIGCRTLEDAVNKAPVVPEGFYLVLKNPADDHGADQPTPGTAGKNSPVLRVGRKINIPGPCMFALWPGQDAKVIRGHHLRSNQYLLVRVYNEEEARENWGKAVMKRISDGDESLTEGVLSDELPNDLTVGRQLVIKGTEVSFYIPPTGISIVPENNYYVRDALTLERLEYCILVDENGNKRYEQGPQVVFPAPTETFIQDKNQRKFRAIELNEIQGLHIKVIAPYLEEDGTTVRKEGDELFITGAQTAIYFPREEHSIIRYDGKSKHFATAIPDGEGRYVMDRMTGQIKTTQGPAMLLPDPRSNVVIRRVLSQRQCNLWYPGNHLVASYNEHLEELVKNAPTTRSGVISEGDYDRGTGKKSPMRRFKGSNSVMMESSAQNGDQHVVGEAFSRGSTYTEPRTVTLDTKLQGVPTVEVWGGYAVMIRNKKGARRVVEGPDTVLLDYDESLEPIELSTGKPKTTDNLLKTVFLRTKNNQITDYVKVETADHVQVRIKVQLMGDFVGASEKWWDVENFIKQVCDHARSVLKGKVREASIDEFHSTPENFVRDAILGKKTEEGTRPGMSFEQFGFNVSDVEVQEAQITDPTIRDLLDRNQHAVVSSNLNLAKAQRELTAVVQMQELARENNQTVHNTKLLQLSLKEEVDKTISKMEEESTQRQKGKVLANGEVQMAAVANKVQQEIKALESAATVEEMKLEQALARQELTIARMEAETEAVVKKAAAVSPKLATAIIQLAETKKFSDLLSNFGDMAAIKGLGTVAAAEQVLDFLPPGTFQKIDKD